MAGRSYVAPPLAGQHQKLHLLGTSPARCSSRRTCARGAFIVRAESAASASTSTPKIPDAYVEGVDPEIAALQEHQKSAARISTPEAARTLLANVKNAVLTTMSTRSEAAGFPFGSAIQFAATKRGKPVFASSRLSQNNKDLTADPKCCLTVLAEPYQGPQDSRLTISGTARKLSEDEAASAREAFLQKHPKSFWVDFGDFDWWRIEDIKTIFLVAGFGGGKQITVEELGKASPDPVAAFSGPVAGHMNADHEEDTKAMVKHYVGLTVDKAKILDLDRLGMNLEVTRNGDTFKLRLPFVTPADNRKAIKDAIVEMTKAARAAAKKE